MGEFPSGQRGQTVNLLQIASVVRIHLHPLSLRSKLNVQCTCRRGGTGRRTGLKILRDLYSRTGSIPVAGINMIEENVQSAEHSLFLILANCFTLFYEVE